MERKKSANDIVAQWKRIVKFGGFADTKFTRVQYMGI